MRCTVTSVIYIGLCTLRQSACITTASRWILVYTLSQKACAILTISSLNAVLSRSNFINKSILFYTIQYKLLLHQTRQHESTDQLDQRIKNLVERCQYTIKEEKLVCRTELLFHNQTF